jgi:hypothetical protein
MAGWLRWKKMGAKRRNSCGGEGIHYEQMEGRHGGLRKASAMDLSEIDVGTLQSHKI